MIALCAGVLLPAEQEGGGMLDRKEGDKSVDNNVY